MIINGLGGIMMIVGLVLAFAVGWVVDEVWPNANKGVAAGAGVYFLVTISADLVYRWTHFRERGRVRFVHPFTGGMLFFIPLWVWGVAPLVALPIVWVFNPPKKIPPPRAATSPAYYLESTWKSAHLGKPA